MPPIGSIFIRSWRLPACLMSPSQTTPVLADTKQDAGGMCSKLAEFGIIVRNAAGFGLPQHLRITVAAKRILTAWERLCKTAEALEKKIIICRNPSLPLHSYVVLMYNHSKDQCKLL